MLFSQYTFLWFGVLCTLLHSSLMDTLPTAVALGGAIVAAVEEDAYNAQRLQLDVAQRRTSGEPWQNLADMPDIMPFDEARGKHKKRQKILKHLYPLLIGAVIAKSIIVPLILKTLTALSASSFIMAKIALAASGLLALKWIYNEAGKEHTRFEIVHLPWKSGGGGGGGNGYNDWNDLTWSGSSYVDVKTTPKQRFKYIPLFEGIANTISGSKTASSGKNSLRYESSFDGKPFL